MSAVRLISALLLASLALTAWGGPVEARPPHLLPETLTWNGPKAPFKQRLRRDEAAVNPNGQGLIDLSKWPAEPPSPAEISKDALASALLALCGSYMPSERPGRYAGWILEHSAHFQVDPLIVAGLVISRSKCKPRHKTDEGIGLTLIHDKMHWGHLKDRVYHYRVFADGAWRDLQLDLGRHPFTRRQLNMPGSHIYFAAGFLRVAMDQCPHNDGAFGSVPHRHPVSHVLWGDKVRGTDGEDRVLRIRRMLIEHITGRRAPYVGHYKDLPLVSPLDGAPRKLTSIVGDERDGGRRKHAGIDFASYIGEPVRAVADGTVIFAGIGGMNVAPSAMWSIKRKPMGKAGIYVKVQHEGDIVSAYMHLTKAVVKKGEVVKAGQLIGTVGRTGIQQSSAHLHFELREGGERVDPLPALRPMVFEPLATWRGVRMRYHKRERARKARKARLKRRRESKRTQHGG